jgi:hypothetical protein
MIEHWWRHLEDGVEVAQVLLVAATRADADDLGRRAQARLLNAGRLGRPFGSTDKATLYVGDRVVATRNDWRLEVRNGDRGTVVSAAPESGLVVSFDRTGARTLPAAYTNRHLHQGYGLTAHRAQGLTVAHTLLLGSDALYRELGYSALSRGRDTNSIYLTDTADSADPVDPIDALVEQLTWSRADDPAVDALPQLPDLGNTAHAREAWIERLRLATTITQPDQGAEQPILNHSDLARYRQLTGRLAQRERLLGHAARWQQPDWARTVLGPLPTSRTAEANWIAAAGAIAAYRERWELTTAICPRPSGAIQELDWIALCKKLTGLQPDPRARSTAATHSQQPEVDLDRQPGAARSLGL